MKNLKMDAEEKQLLAAFEGGRLKKVRNEKAEIAALRTAAKNTLAKNKRINIRLSEGDLLGIQAKAVEEGLPYQTLISSVLHKYLRGSLIERTRA